MKTLKLRKLEGTFRVVETCERVEYAEGSDARDVIAMNLGFGNFGKMEQYLESDWV